MHEPIFVLETASAHLRELLFSSCTRHAPTAVFASVRAARSSLEMASPAVLVIGGAPLDDTTIEVARLRSNAAFPACAARSVCLGSQTGAFAQHLDEDTQWQVREASDGARVERGVALIAPGGQHLRSRDSFASWNGLRFCGTLIPQRFLS
jgi:two-component system chemotaxis response regulator CheB